MCQVGILHGVVGEDRMPAVVVIFVALFRRGLFGQFRKTQLDQGLGYFQWASPPMCENEKTACEAVFRMEVNHYRAELKILIPEATVFKKASVSL